MLEIRDEERDYSISKCVMSGRAAGRPDMLLTLCRVGAVAMAVAAPRYTAWAAGAFFSCSMFASGSFSLFMSCIKINADAVAACTPIKMRQIRNFLVRP